MNSPRFERGGGFFMEQLVLRTILMAPIIFALRSLILSVHIRRHEGSGCRSRVCDHVLG